MRNFFFFVVLMVFVLGVFVFTVEAETALDFKEGDMWSYFKGTEDPPSTWNDIVFDDSNWLTGVSGFGFGDSSYNTHLDDMQGNYKSLYVRKLFKIDNPSLIKMVILRVVCDGSFRAYINGVEVARSKTKLTEQLDITGFAHEIRFGDNVLSVQVLTDDSNHNSFSFSPFFKIITYKKSQNSSN
ncbi:MAG: hypothetical protein MRK02_05850 [Candidatus Scalindua sp.]|nr:hypothetical protein [Candidatus Scalindua sp.]